MTDPTDPTTDGGPGDETEEASGRGGSLGTGGLGDQPDELQPEEDPDDSFVVSGGGVADVEDADDGPSDD